ncbi:MAG: hypothetical protein EBU85_01740 [Actinobacteria bacterium]|nr:hypothetical protein [Actinomycetota bacterium]
MAVMWWWAVPLTTTLAAWSVVLWRSRASLHRDPVVTVQRLSRFRGAMARVHADDGATWHRGEAPVSGVNAVKPVRSVDSTRRSDADGSES